MSSTDIFRKRKWLCLRHLVGGFIQELGDLGREGCKTALVERAMWMQWREHVYLLLIHLWNINTPAFCLNSEAPKAVHDTGGVPNGGSGAIWSQALSGGALWATTIHPLEVQKCLMQHQWALWRCSAASGGLLNSISDFPMKTIGNV